MIRKKAFGIFGGFLAVMLVFTILSRAASGASMARVETVRISTGTIDHRVSASGRVEAGKEIAVYTEGAQRVEEIFVREGQMVEKGEVLFQISLSELEEQITAARQDMEKMRLQNQDILNSRNQEQQDQATARNRAAEDYDAAVLKGEQSIAEAKSAWEAAEGALREFLESSADERLYSQEQEISGEGSLSGQTDDSAGGEESGAEWEVRKSELEQAAADAKQAYDEAVSSNDQNILAAKRALEDSSKGLTLDSTLEQNEITRQQEELKLNKLIELKAAEGKIQAPVRGTVTEIMITTGDFTSDQTAIRMADASGESCLTVSVDRTEGEFISAGSSVEIKASGKTEKICDYTVTDIIENKEDKTLLDIRIHLPGGVLEAGTYFQEKFLLSITMICEERLRTDCRVKTLFMSLSRGTGLILWILMIQLSLLMKFRNQRLFITGFVNLPIC